MKYLGKGPFSSRPASKEYLAGWEATFRRFKPGGPSIFQGDVNPGDPGTVTVAVQFKPKKRRKR